MAMIIFLNFYLAQTRVLVLENELPPTYGSDKIF